MSNSKLTRIIALTVILSLLLTPLVHAEVRTPVVTDGPSAQAEAGASHRLIVELDSPPLAVAYLSEVSAAAANGKLDANAPAAQAYVNQLRAEQAAFVSTMRTVLADASVATFISEAGVTEEATYQVAFNGLAVNPGATDQEQARLQLAKLPGVKNVYLDVPHQTHLYTSTALINAPAVWDVLGGTDNAGAGVKVASMDGGVHKDAPMFSGAGYSYPPGYGPNGLGLTANNNGKIIVSRAYFRDWDPPAAGDRNPWPGENGTSHGVHTASTAAGNCVNDVTYLGFSVGTLCGVAPSAYVMSYRVFYPSVNGNESFYTAEGLAALEDIVRDGADVLNNSWGEGPISEGGLFDPIDTALINAVRAGIFVSMSTGNAGPGLGTSDHPSADYISVAASTTSGTLAAGKVSVPNEPSLQDIPFGTASFGAPLPLTQVIDYSYVPASVVNPANATGCNPWPAGAFAGKAALILRGGCEFGVKVLNAEQAGAVFAVVYNNASGGNEILNMAPGAVGDQVTISSIFIGHTNGTALVNLYNTQGAAAATLRIDTNAFQIGNEPDRIIDFSSRGPGVGNTLKPDIAAPGVNILAQGYAPLATGEAQHLGYGQVSGTSMAAPHVSGAAALLRQRYPTWSNAAIKSALMSTAKYMDIYVADGVTPAQPLDMGAGRLDVAAALDPGVILDPPSLAFGIVPTGTQQVISVTVTNISTTVETYILSTLDTGAGFAPTQTTALPGFSASPTSLTLNPGESKVVQITFNPAQGRGYGENQGFILLDGDRGHDAHMPAWARVTYAQPLADVLIIDNDFSDELGLPDYRWYYTNALEQLGYTYSVVSTVGGVGGDTTIPAIATLLAYKAVILFTGDNFYANGSFTVSTGLTQQDQDRLVEYLNNGGALIAMGQDLSSMLDANTRDASVGGRNFLYVYRLGANWIQDSVSNGETPESFIVPAAEAPAFLDDVIVDLTKPRQARASGELSGDQEVPPVNTPTEGEFSIFHNLDRNYTEFAVTVTPSTTNPITVTGMHIHVGVEGVNGPIIRNLAAIANVSLPVFVTDTLEVSGVISPSFTVTEVQQLLNNQLYINVHTTDNLGGEIRGQIEPRLLPNQRFVDEIDNRFYDGSQDPNGDGTTSESNLGSTPLLRYAGPFNIYQGTVAMGHRDQPSLERPGTDYSGRSVYATFGLEGMSNELNATLESTPTTRSELLGAFLDWTWSQPPTTVQITDTTVVSSSLYIFDAQAAYGLQRSADALTPQPVQYRWDFGDGSAYVRSEGAQASHQYLCGADNMHTVRVEITDNYGNVVIGTKEINVSDNCATNTAPVNNLYLPFVTKN